MMLSYFCNNHRVPLGHIINCFHNIGSGQHALVIPQRIHILHPLYMIYPLIMVNRVQTGIDSAKHHLQITNNTCMGTDIFINLCRVHINLKNFSISGKLGGISCNTVTETRSCHNQQITFCNPVVGSFGSVHSHHAGIHLIGSVKCTFAHKRICHRSLYPVSQRSKLLRRISQHSAASYKDKRLFCLAD